MLAESIDVDLESAVLQGENKEINDPSEECESEEREKHLRAKEFPLHTLLIKRLDEGNIIGHDNPKSKPTPIPSVFGACYDEILNGIWHDFIFLRFNFESVRTVKGVRLGREERVI
jgi:hypothetical protein